MEFIVLDLVFDIFSSIPRKNQCAVFVCFVSSNGLRNYSPKYSKKTFQDKGSAMLEKHWRGFWFQAVSSHQSSLTEREDLTRFLLVDMKEMSWDGAILKRWKGKWWASLQVFLKGWAEVRYWKKRDVERIDSRLRLHRHEMVMEITCCLPSSSILQLCLLSRSSNWRVGVRIETIFYVCRVFLS